ncbi:MAG: hypothetical protein ACP5QG_08560 [candidate division WOR-3 bacterium]
MTSFLIILIASSVDIGGDFSLGLSYAYPSVNLFLFNPGFENPALARGLVGFNNNPAGLAYLAGGEWGECMGVLAISAYSGINDTAFLPVDSAGLDSLGIIFSGDTLKFPYSFSGGEKWGLDYLAYGARIGKKGDWTVGLGFTRGDFLGLDIEGGLHGSALDSITFQDTITSADIPGLPQGTIIPVLFGLAMGGNASVNISGHGGFTTLPFVGAIARKSGGWSYGAGVKVTPVWGNATMSALAAGDISGTAILRAEPYLGDTWRIEAEFTGELENDTLVKYYLDGNVTTLNPSLVLGMGWQGSWLGVALAIERGSPTSMTGDWAHSAMYPWGGIDWDIDYDSLIIDTLNHIISGKGKLIIHGLEEDTAHAGGPIESFIGNVSGARVGTSIGIPLSGFLNCLGCLIPWLSARPVVEIIEPEAERFVPRVILGNSLGIILSDNGKYMKISCAGSISTNTNIQVNLSGIFYWQSYFFGGIPITSIPVLAGGLGVSFPVGYGRAYLSARANSSGILSAMVMGYAGAETSKKSQVYASFGMGFSYPLGPVKRVRN